MLVGMSSSIISFIIASPSLISAISTFGLPQYSFLMVIALIILYSLKEILSSCKLWNNYLNNSFNLVIIPFIFCFVIIVIYRAIIM